MTRLTAVAMAVLSVLLGITPAHAAKHKHEYVSGAHFVADLSTGIIGHNGVNGPAPASGLPTRMNFDFYRVRANGVLVQRSHQRVHPNGFMVDTTDYQPHCGITIQFVVYPGADQVRLPVGTLPARTYDWSTPAQTPACAG